MAKRRKSKTSWCLKAGKTTVKKFRKKSTAKKAATARRKSGRKARVVKCAC